MKRLLLALALAAPLAMSAATTATLQGKEYAVDTLRHYYIGPGVTQSVMRFSTQGHSFNASVTTFDRVEGADVVPQVIIGCDSCNTAETVSSMARRYTTDDRQVLAGINGDFFITSSFASQHEFGNAILGYPNVTCAIDRRLAAPDIIDIGSRENCLVIADESWYIDATDMGYCLLNNDGSTVVRASAVNYPRRGGEMVMYNSFAGKYTSTGQDGRELTLRLAPGAKWAINKSVKMIVESDWRQGGCSAIPEDGIVISCGPEYANDFVDGLKKGDEVKIKITCSLPAFGVKPSVTDIIGGDVRILKENVTTTEAIRWINTPTAHYSRTMAGYDKERTKMVMCCVDGGWAASSGVSYFEGADLMRFLGCWDALDLDGGGSTEMWSASHGIVNHLRDGSERPVGNGLFFTLKAPADKTVTSIRFADPVAKLPLYGLYQPVIYGYNRYGQLVDTDVKGFTLSTDPALGNIDGSALLATGSGTHALTATLADMSATIAVTVDNSCPAQPVLGTIITDPTHSWPIQLVATVGDKEMSVSPKAYTWTSDNPKAVTVDTEGCVTGVTDGEATVTGTSESGTVSVKVIAQCPPALYADLFAGTAAASDWKISKSSVGTVTFAPVGNEGGFSLDFKVTATRGPQVTVSRKLQMWGLPDALEFVINPGATAPEKTTLSTLTADNATTNVKTELAALTPGQDNTVRVPVSEICDCTVDNYPLTFNSLRFDYKATGQYNVTVSHLRAVYDSYDAGIADITADAVTGSRLPVTVTDGTVSIPFAADILEARDLTGRLVATVSGASSLTLSPGFYILTARKAGRTLSAKIRL